jgi:DNA-binding CsgD family transcriptional regulator
MASLLLPVHFLSEPAVIWFRFDRDFLLKENQTLYEGLELISNALDCIGMKSYLKSVSPVHFGSMHLSDRELQVARLVASGSSNLQVARVLNFSESWVKQLLGQVFVKLDIRSRRELEQLSE